MPRLIGEHKEILNRDVFRKMAYGDPAALRELAYEFFNDARLRMTAWTALVEAGECDRLREELHRCKGGAVLFGLDRLIEMISSAEAPHSIELSSFNLAEFEAELSLAEAAVDAMVD